MRKYTDAGAGSEHGSDVFFGYGSLVNRATHTYLNPRPATVTGWRRMWRHTSLRPVAYLTVMPCPGGRLDGMLADVPGRDWAALDLREAAYIRSPAETGRSAQIYHIPEGHHAAPTQTHPILLSYVDTVVQGYLATFGQGGVARFFDTTDGWNAPILNDRAAPSYPRATVLTGAERAMVDRLLISVGATVT